MDEADIESPAVCCELQVSPTMVAPVNTLEIEGSSGTIEEMNRCNNNGEQIAINYYEFPRFPSDLLKIGRERGYIAPRTIAIGPYYHGKPEFQRMENVKRTAVRLFIDGLELGGGLTPAIIEPIIGSVQDCYGDMDAVRKISDADFCYMMFIDGCFLLLFMCSGMFRRGIVPTETPENLDWRTGVIMQQDIRGIRRDIMLLENQIPWAVIARLMGPLRFLKEDIVNFLVDAYPSVIPKEYASQQRMDIGGSHLLGLLLDLVHSKGQRISNLVSERTRTYHASELAEMGIKLEARKTATANFTGVMNMEMVKGLLSAKLAVQPLNLGNASACLLINMAALELYSETALLKDAGELPVSSYLCVLGLMMNQAEDVRKLRHKGIVQGLFGDQHILEFFKDLCPNLVAGQAYWQIFRDIEVYRKKRRLWLAIYKFVYKNAKTIAAVLSIVGVLVGIFKAILSLKSNHE